MTEPISMDPAFLQGSNDFQVAANLHEGLFRYDPATGKAIPALTASFSTSPDGLTWEFKIDSEARFSDGTPVTARDFEISWLRILDPATASPGADALYFIKGARQFNAGTASAKPGVYAVDDATLRLVLEHPQPYLPEMLCSPRLAPVRVATDKKGAHSVIGTGPFVLVEWRPRQKAIFGPNPYYARWTSSEARPGGDRSASSSPPAAQEANRLLPRLGPHRPGLESGGLAVRVVLLFAQTEDSAVAWWESGQADLVVGLVPVQRVPILVQKHGRQVVTRPMRSVFYFMFNMRRPALAQAATRERISAAIERDTIVSNLLAAGQFPAYGFLPDMYAGRGPGALVCERLRPGAGTQSSAEKDASIGAIELLSNSSETLKAILELTQQSLKKRAGLDVTLRLLEWKSFLSLVQGGEFDVARYSLTGGPDPIDFFDNFSTDHSNDVSGFSDTEYDKLVASAKAERNVEKRNAALIAAHGILCARMPAAPVYFSSQVFLAKQSLVEGLSPDPEGILYWEDLIEESK